MCKPAATTSRRDYMTASVIEGGMMFTKLRWRFYMWRHPLDLGEHFHIADYHQTRLDQELEQILHEKSLERWE